MAAEDAPNPKNEPVSVQRFTDELLALVSNGVPAFLYLIVYGLIIAGKSLNTTMYALIGAAFVIDLLSEYWVYTGPYRRDSDRLHTFAHLHYGLAGAAYVVLLGGILVFPDRLFIVYSLFLLLWLASFLVGEALLMFLDDRFEQDVPLA